MVNRLKTLVIMDQQQIGTAMIDQPLSVLICEPLPQHCQLHVFCVELSRLLDNPDYFITLLLQRFQEMHDLFENLIWTF